MTLDEAATKVRKLRTEMLANVPDEALASHARLTYQECLAHLDLARIALERAAMQQALALASRS